MDINRNSSWAKSAGGLDLELYWSPSKKLTELENSLLIIGGVHGDEPEGVFLAQKVLGYIPKLMTQDVSLGDWALIPCLNPDGFKDNQRVNANGVDLNRNYPASNWSKDHDQLRYFPGLKPQSESEIRALVKLIKTIKPSLIIHCHSWKPCIVCSGEPGLEYAKLLGQSSGYEVINSIGYPTPGSLSQYGWTDFNIPVICIEEAEQPITDEIWNRFKAGFENVFKLHASKAQSS